MRPQSIGMVRFDSIPEPNRAALENTLDELYDRKESNRYYSTQNPAYMSGSIRENIRETGPLDLDTGLGTSNYLESASKLNLDSFQRIESYIVDDGSRNFIDTVSVGLVDDDEITEILELDSARIRDHCDEWRSTFDLLWRSAFEFVRDQENPIDTYAHHSKFVECCLCIDLPVQWSEWSRLGDYDSIEEFFEENQEHLEQFAIDCASVMNSGCASLLATGDIVAARDRTSPWEGVTILDVAPAKDIKTPGWPDGTEGLTSTTRETLYTLIPFFRAYRWGQARIHDLNTMEVENRENLGLVRDTERLQSMVDSLSEINAQRELTLRIRDEQSEIGRFTRRLETNNLGGIIYRESLEEGRPEEYSAESNTSLINAYQSVLDDVVDEFETRFNSVDDNQSSTADIVQSRIDASANKTNVSLQDQIAESVETSSKLQERVYILTLVLAALTVVLVADTLWSPVIGLLTTLGLPMQTLALGLGLILALATFLFYSIKKHDYN